jgi:putative ABC transport system permease protein
MFHLVLVNLFRNPLRSALTMGSVMLALFLFCALGGVLDTLQEAIKVGSESRLITRNKVSLIFPMPKSYMQRLRAVDGVKNVAIENWFGGQDPANTRDFFAQFAVDENFFPMYSPDMRISEFSPLPAGAPAPAGVDPRLAAFATEQTACVVGAKLMAKRGWKLGQQVTVRGTIYPGDWTFTIRGVYEAKKKSFDESTLFFHFRYLEQKGMGGAGQVGIYVLELTDPARANAVAQTIDGMFQSSAPSTRTESEQAFQAGFVSMYGNLPFVLRLVGLAIVFSILLIAANTMMTSMRERTNEFAVLKTLGFTDGAVFAMVVTEAAVITVGGGALGALAAKFSIEKSGFNFMGFLPPMSVYWSTVFIGIGIALFVGMISGFIPALQASRLRIVDALRTVD